MDEIVTEFLVESYENLDRLDRDFVELEKNPSKEALGSIFRAIHTIKGTCGFLGLGKLESVTHVGESLLSSLRDGALQVSPKIIDALLAMVDAVRQMLASIEATGHEGERNDSALIETLRSLQKLDETSTVTVPPSTAPLPSAAISHESAAKAQDTSPPANTKSETPRAPEPTVSAVLPEEPEFDGMPVDQGKILRAAIDHALVQQANGDPRRIGEILIQQAAVKTAEGLETLQNQGESRAAVADSTIRVDVGLLDKVMNLVGELVLSRNQIMQFAANHEDSTFVATTQHLNLVTGELQEGVMKTRMQPIGNVWNRFPRVVRDLAAACGKQVRVIMEGAETELDRTIIEAIKDPMTHVLRNSVDHGIERPQDRVAAGKPAEGCLYLRAYHEGGQVNLEISDDGGGMNPEKIRDKALQKGMITANQSALMSDREIVNLVFLPGFSTAEEVTNVSGRGVGMDVVKTNIEKIGGNVDMQSRLGMGTTLKIKIPLTLAIIPALMVVVGEQRYAIPQVSLLELVRLDGELARKGVEMIHGAPVYRLRGRLLPLVYLSGELKLPARQLVEDGNINIVVLQADGRQFGLVVDGISDVKDIVVKPLGKHLKGLPVFSGATIMGDGRVALILDVIGISQSANVVTEGRERSIAEAATPSRELHSERQSLLLCQCGHDRIALPLAVVARLEQFGSADIERSGGREVVQYRGEIMPLIRLASSESAGGEENEKESLQVVVYHDRGRSVGLVVDQIMDIVEELVTVKSDYQWGNFTGTAVVQGRVTDILDVRAAIESADPNYLAHAEAA